MASMFWWHKGPFEDLCYLRELCDWWSSVMDVNNDEERGRGGRKGRREVVWQWWILKKDEATGVGSRGQCPELLQWDHCNNWLVGWVCQTQWRSPQRHQRHWCTSGKTSKHFLLDCFGQEQAQFWFPASFPVTDPSVCNLWFWSCLCLPECCLVSLSLTKGFC